MSGKSLYPSFNVLNEREAWDPHTQTIVVSRLSPKTDYDFLTQPEADRLRSICSLLIDDRTPEVLDFILNHIDQSLHQSPGESQRKAGVPPAPELIRSGLEAVEQGALSNYEASFIDLEAGVQSRMLQQISGMSAEPKDVWGATPQDAWFAKLLNMTVESYASHPKVWSEIGYAGPAYPRGYVRAELGLLDPWEAQPER